MIKEVKVDTGVPIPERRKKGKYDMIPFEEMNIGDSCLLARCTTPIARRRYKAIYSGVYKSIARRKIPGKFRMGVVEEHGSNKVEIRIWKVE